VRAVLALAGDGDAVGAWRTIVERNPLPGVCGRVCYHPCEASCNRSALDDRLAVHAIERAIAAEAARQNARTIAGGLPPVTGKRVAIVGSGPAGLSCAYHLARQGHRAVIFEAADEPGGMLRYGIPAYRLPREVLAGEIDLLRTLGIEFRFGRRLGATLSWDDLAAYDATFVAVGRQRSKGSDLAGEQLTGVRPAMDFLREVNGGRASRVAGSVIVVGGGNTALDAARVALGRGAAVTIVYRRSRREMPAHPAEVAQAELEGVQFVFHAAPVEYIASPEGVLGSVDCQRMRPGPADESGRSSPQPIPGETFSICCNHVLTAIGEELEEEAFERVLTIARGRLQSDRWGRTPSAPLFAGGDAATGAGTVVEAIGSGRRAAEAIDASLSGGIVSADAGAAGRVDVPDLNLFYFFRARRVDEAMLHRVEATSGFREVAQPLEWDEAMAEARRSELRRAPNAGTASCSVPMPQSSAPTAPDTSSITRTARAAGSASPSARGVRWRSCRRSRDDDQGHRRHACHLVRRPARTSEGDCRVPHHAIVGRRRAARGDVCGRPARRKVRRGRVRAFRDGDLRRRVADRRPRIHGDLVARPALHARDAALVRGRAPADRAGERQSRRRIPVEHIRRSERQPFAARHRLDSVLL
jgi:NADPH-dependent glutamate synthase beta subunit-like oxidoreductase